MKRRKIYHARLMDARPFIDSLNFAGNGGQICGEVSLAEMPRLLEMLESTKGTMRYEVRGGTDTHGHPLLNIAISGNCRLRCQRCLDGLDYAVLIDTCLLLRDQSEMDALDKDDVEEEFDSILADASLDILNLLEEEILLSMPIAPTHEFGACQIQMAETGRKERNPFAVLAELKRN